MRKCLLVALTLIMVAGVAQAQNTGNSSYRFAGLGSDAIVATYGIAKIEPPDSVEYWLYGGARFEDGGNKAAAVGIKLPPILGISSLVYMDVSQYAQIQITPAQFFKTDFFNVIDGAFLFTGAALTWTDVTPDNVQAILGAVGGFGLYKVVHTSKSGSKTGAWLAVKSLTALPGSDKLRFQGAIGLTIGFKVPK